MDYKSEGYGNTVEQVKPKNYKIPIIIVIVVAIIAAVVIYLVTSAAKTTYINGESLTTANLSDYEADIAERFYIDSQNITMYSDGSATVDGGNITSLNLNLSIEVNIVTEYWTLQDDDDGAKMKYKKQIDSDFVGCYTLSQLCAYLTDIDGILNASGTASYTAYFSTVLSTTAQADGYIWGGESFELLTEDTSADCYPITVTTTGGTQYIFYAV